MCGGGSSGGSKGAKGEALVYRITAVVPGTSEAAARQALHVACGDYLGAVQYLKVEKLYRSGLVLFVPCCYKTVVLACSTCLYKCVCFFVLSQVFLLFFQNYAF